MKRLISLFFLVVCAALPVMAQKPNAERTVRASRINGPLKIDGKFEDEVYEGKGLDSAGPA